MRRWLLPLVALIWLAWASPAEATATLVQSCTGQVGSGTTVTCTFGGSTTATNDLMCFVGWDSGSITLTSIALTADTLTLVHNPTSGTSGRAAAGHKVNITGGNTVVTATLSSSIKSSIGCYEVSSAGTFEDSNANAQTTPGTGTAAVVSGNIVRTNADCFLGGATFDYSWESSDISAGTGFTGIFGSNTVAEVESQIFASGGTTQATFTNTSGNTSNITLGIAVCSAGGGGGPTPVPSGLSLLGVGNGK